MLTAYKHSTTNEIVETNINQSASWINVVEPDREEIEHLIEQYNLPKILFVTLLMQMKVHVLNMTKILAILFIIVDLPIVSSTNRHVLSFVTIPLGIVIGNGVIFTICDAENEFLENYSRQDNVNLKFHSRFVLDILFTISNHYNRNLRLLNKSRIRIERDLKIVLRINNFIV